ncbi:MAG TPA: ribonuclease P protein component [Chloroflexi bacterium]|nr:ribonuclease P protein component [Chloroflexota bacterium]
MKRRFRLRRTADFQRLQREGRSWSHPLLVLVARRNDLNVTRVGVLATRKIGKAVHRNRAKRLLREAARHLHPRLEPGWDLLLIARSEILQAKEPQVREALARLAREAGLMGGSGEG